MQKQNNKGSLLVIMDDPAIMVNGKVYSSSSAILFFSQFITVFDSVTISIPLRQAQRTEDWFMQEVAPHDNLHIAARGYYYKKKEALLKPYKFIKSFLSTCVEIAKADYVLYRLPSIYLPLLLLPLILFGLRKKVVLYIAGDHLLRNKLDRHVTFKKILTFIAAYIYSAFESIAARVFKTVVTGQALAKKYSADLFDVSLIREHEISKTQREMDPDNVILLFVGTLNEIKGVDILLQAIALMDFATREKMTVNIVGSGPEEAKLKRMALDLKLDQTVIFKGGMNFGDELKQLYMDSDIFILSSRSEGVPKVLYEAMAYGLAIVAFDVGGVSHATNGGSCAYLVADRTPSGLNDAIIRIMNDKTLKKSIVCSGFDKVKENTMEAKIRKLTAILKD